MPDDNLPYLFAAFAITWAVLFLYTFFVGRKQHDMEREVRSLKQELVARGSSGGMDPEPPD